MRRAREPSEDLAKLSEAVAKWREQHGGGGRGSKIPDDLWNEAVRVARVDGVADAEPSVAHGNARWGTPGAHDRSAKIRTQVKILMFTRGGFTIVHKFGERTFKFPDRLCPNDLQAQSGPL